MLMCAASHSYEAFTVFLVVRSRAFVELMLRNGTKLSSIFGVLNLSLLVVFMRLPRATTSPKLTVPSLPY